MATIWRGFCGGWRRGGKSGAGVSWRVSSASSSRCREAADALRRRRNEGDNRAADARLAVISACDPLNLAGILTPGPRVAATPGNRLAYRDGIPIAAMEGGQFVALSNAPGGVLEQARTLLSVPVAHANFRMQCEALATA